MSEEIGRDWNPVAGGGKPFEPSWGPDVKGLVSLKRISFCSPLKGVGEAETVLSRVPGDLMPAGLWVTCRAPPAPTAGPRAGGTTLVSGFRIKVCLGRPGSGRLGGGLSPVLLFCALGCGSSHFPSKEGKRDG